jgi:hypothetical protein
VGLECGLEELDALVVSDKHESAANAAKNVREVALKKRSINMVLAKRMPKHMTIPTHPLLKTLFSSILGIELRLVFYHWTIRGQCHGKSSCREIPVRGKIRYTNKAVFLKE